MNVLETDLAGIDPQRQRTRLVLDLGILPDQREHLLDVERRLLDLAIDGAHEIQRLVELDQHGVDQHEIADRMGAGAKTAHRHYHRERQAGGEDDCLAKIEPGERV
jgi:DNA-directed RNA polymerase specialized sigma24 family protein